MYMNWFLKLNLRFILSLAFMSVLVVPAPAQNVKGRAALQGLKALTAGAKNNMVNCQIERQIANPLRSPRLLNSVESKKILFPQTKAGPRFFVPLPLNTTETAVYKGLALPNLEALENITKNGLELNKIQSRSAYGIFASNQLQVAMEYTLPATSGPVIPVLIKIPITERCKPMGYNGHFVFVRNVPPAHIAEIMAFLEINGKATWYKVTWQKDKMVLVPAPSEQIPANELMVHYFQTWPINLDMD